MTGNGQSAYVAFLGAMESNLSVESPFGAQTCGALRRIASAANAQLVAAWRASDIRPSNAPLVSLAALHRLKLEHPAEVECLDRQLVEPQGEYEYTRDLQKLIREHADRLQGYVREAPIPCTNERTRVAALVGALSVTADDDLVASKPTRLLELGASAGLNLSLNGITADVHDAEVAVSLGENKNSYVSRWSGAYPTLNVPQDVESLGCDLRPLNFGSIHDRTILRSFILPDQTLRLHHFDAMCDDFDKLQLRTQALPRVSRRDAVDWLEEERSRPDQRSLTVIWHSGFLQYLPIDTVDSLRRVIETWGRACREQDRMLAWCRFEPAYRDLSGRPRFALTMTTWPSESEIVLAYGDPYALQLNWTTAH